MANITTTTGAVFIPEVWSVETLRAAENALVMAPIVKRYDALVKSRGDTIHIPNISNLTANTKTQGSEVTTQAVTETETSISISTWVETSFEIEDIVKTQSQYDLRTEYTEKAGFAIAEKVDTDLLGLYSSLTSTDVGTYGTDKLDVPMESDLHSKTPEFGENLLLETTASQALKWEGVETMRESSLEDDEIVRTAWRHADYGRNVHSPVFYMTGVTN